MLRRISFAALLVLALAASFGAERQGTTPPPADARLFNQEEAAALTAKYCVSCHRGPTPRGGLDLESLAFAPADADNFRTWVKVHDRLQAGEMPPKTRKLRPAPAELDAFLARLATALTAPETDAAARDGRAMQRRLNRYEYENALRDLLHAPWLQVKEQLPEDGETYRFNKSGAGLTISHVHLSRYMAAADGAMREVMSLGFRRPPSATRRYYAREEESLTKFWPNIFTPSPDRLTFPVIDAQGQPDVRARTAPITVGDADPETREREAVGWTHGNYVTGFGSSWRNFRAPVAGRYRLRFSGYTIWVGPGGRNTKYQGRTRQGRHARRPRLVPPQRRRHFPRPPLRANHRLRQGRPDQPASRRLRRAARPHGGRPRRSVACCPASIW